MRRVSMCVLVLACTPPAVDVDEEPATEIAEGPCGEFGTEDGDGCMASLSMTPCEALPEERDHLGTVLVEAGGRRFILATGGLDAGAIGAEASRARDGLYFAEVGDDGVLGAWVQGQLPEARAGHGIASFNGRVYLIGGLLDFGAAAGPGLDTWTPRVISGVFSPETGTLEDVIEEAPIPESIWHIQAAAYDGELIAIGGRSPQGVASTLSVRAVFEGSTLVDWVPYDVGLQRGRTHHGLASHGSQIFLAGGLNDNGAMASILRGNPDEPGVFEREFTLATPRITASTWVLGDLLFVGSGLTDTGIATSVEAFPVGGSQNRSWTVDIPDLPIGVGHIHQVPTFENAAYIVGGRTSSGSASQCLHVEMNAGDI